MIKLAFSTLSCDGWTPERIIEYCKDNGFTGIEIREGQGAILSIDSDIKEIERISTLFQASGIIVTDLGSSICIKGMPEEKQTVANNTKKAVSIAVCLKAIGIRVFLGNFTERKDSPKTDLNYEGIVETLQFMCDEALPYGVEIWVETHNEFSTGKILNKLMTDVNRRNIKVIWDIIHPLEAGESPEETLAYLGKSCVHIHVKDGTPWQDPMLLNWKYTNIGEGDIPIRRIFELLSDSGYEGFYSLEWENKWKAEIRGIGLDAETILPYYSKFMLKLKVEDK